MALINALARANGMLQPAFLFEKNHLFCTLSGQKLTLGELANLSFLGNAFPGRRDVNVSEFLQRVDAAADALLIHLHLDNVAYDDQLRF